MNFKRQSANNISSVILKRNHFNWLTHNFHYQGNLHALVSLSIRKYYSVIYKVSIWKRTTLKYFSQYGKSTYLFPLSLFWRETFCRLVFYSIISTDGAGSNPKPQILYSKVVRWYPTLKVLSWTTFSKLSDTTCGKHHSKAIEEFASYRE